MKRNFIIFTVAMLGLFPVGTSIYPAAAAAGHKEAVTVGDIKNRAARYQEIESLENEINRSAYNTMLKLKLQSGDSDGFCRMLSSQENLALLDPRISFEKIKEIKGKKSKVTGITPLMLAALHCNSEVVKVLLQNGVDGTAVDSELKTALHYLALSDVSKKDFLEKLDVLLGSHVDIQAKDYKNNTFLDIMKKRNDESLYADIVKKIKLIEKRKSMQQTELVKNPDAIIVQFLSEIISGEQAATILNAQFFGGDPIIVSGKTTIGECFEALKGRMQQDPDLKTRLMDMQVGPLGHLIGFMQNQWMNDPEKMERYFNSQHEIIRPEVLLKIISSEGL